jgi:hypothetical protein
MTSPREVLTLSTTGPGAASAYLPHNGRSRVTPYHTPPAP